jgi:hypothetical protein
VTIERANAVPAAGITEKTSHGRRPGENGADERRAARSGQSMKGCPSAATSGGRVRGAVEAAVGTAENMPLTGRTMREMMSVMMRREMEQLTSNDWITSGEMTRRFGSSSVSAAGLHGGGPRWILSTSVRYETGRRTASDGNGLINRIRTEQLIIPLNSLLSLCSKFKILLGAFLTVYVRSSRISSLIIT